MKTFRLVWSPAGVHIGTVSAKDVSAAKRKAPKMYRKYLGEIRATEVVKVTRYRIFEIAWLADDTCFVSSMINGCEVSWFSHGTWTDNGRMPDDVMVAAMDARPVGAKS